jgi:hypothetical protein
MNGNFTVLTTLTHYVDSGLGSDPKDGFRALRQLIKQQGGSAEDARTEAVSVALDAVM